MQIIRQAVHGIHRDDLEAAIAFRINNHGYWAEILGTSAERHFNAAREALLSKGGQHLA